MRYISLPLTLILILVISNAIAWASFIWTYSTLTYEEPILTLRFEKHGEREYLAHIESPRSIQGKYLIQGDQWRIDVRFVKMKYWSNLLGIESRYSIDRIQGRYIGIQDENSLPNTAHQLGNGEVSHFTIFGWNPFFDTEYGSSTYQSIDSEKNFIVYKTATGIMTRSENAISKNEGGWLNRLWN